MEEELGGKPVDQLQLAPQDVDLLQDAVEKELYCGRHCRRCNACSREGHSTATGLKKEELVEKNKKKAHRQRISRHKGARRRGACSHEGHDAARASARKRRGEGMSVSTCPILATLPSWLSLWGLVGP